MKIKFNKFERVAGLFVLASIVGAVVLSLGVAVKKGWFARKIKFETIVANADGIHQGTVVQVAGIRAGSVDEVELISADKIRIIFYVFEKFHNQIREDSKVSIIRPFVIGDKVVDLSIGSPELQKVANGAFINSVEGFDLMDLVSGRKLAPVLSTFEKFSENLKALAQAFADPKRTQAMVRMFDRLDPLVRNLNQMSLEVSSLTKELNTILPEMNKEMPNMGQQMAQILKNLSVLTTEFQKLTPAIQTIAPELPRTTMRAVEALDETVILLKAMQKSFLLRGKVEEVREMEGKRAPANEK